MKLAQICKSLFDAGDRSRGSHYSATGAVIGLWSDGQMYRAVVEGSQGDYDVEIGPGDVEAKGNVATLHLSCNCGRFAEGYNCKHLWATILTLDRERCDFAQLTGEEFTVLDGRDEFDGDDEPQIVDFANPLPSEKIIRQLISQGLGLRGPAATSKAMSWKRQLKELTPPAAIPSQDLWDNAAAKQREVWYVLNIAASTMSGQLTVELHQRETKKNGEFGKCKPLGLRRSQVERFQTDAKCPLFLISLKAGGQGLNLTAADYVFILDPWWNPAIEAQAVDRAHRMGQTRRVFAYRLICRDTVEDKILQLQQQKRDLADANISADNSVIRSLTSEDLQLLLS